MNISIWICAGLLGIYFVIFGALSAYVDAIDHGFKWYRVLFVFLFYWLIELWGLINMDRY